MSALMAHYLRDILILSLKLIAESFAAPAVSCTHSNVAKVLHGAAVTAFVVFCGNSGPKSTNMMSLLVQDKVNKGEGNGLKQSFQKKG